MTHTNKIRLLSLAVACGLYGTSAAQAQTAEKPQNDEAEVIQIKGFRDSVIRAKDLKRDAMIAQDSIIAEDIADFPDLNLADSLQRIPGVTITREGGEGRQISLRGLGPDFTRVQVNGMEALGSSSSPMDARGAVGRSRAFDFNIFASELFNQIDVKKSYSADQEEGGISGTVNLQTAQPFDYDGFKGAFSSQLGTNTNTDSSDPRIAAMFSNNWDNKFGALFSVAYSNRETNERGTNTTRWRKETGKTAVDANDTALQALLDSGELWFPRGHRYSVWEDDQTRLGITTSLQFRPLDTMTLSLDYMYGKLKNETSEHHHAVKDNSKVKELEYVDNNGDKEVVYASYQDATWRNETREDRNSSTFEQLTLTADWELTDNLKMRALVGSSSSDYEQPKVNKVNINAKKSVDIITDFRDDRFYGVSYSPDFDVTGIDGYTTKDFYFQEDYIYSDFDNAKVDFTQYLGDSGTLNYGANYKKFKNSGYQRTGTPDNDSIIAAGDLALDASMVEVFTGHPDQNWLAADLSAIQKAYGYDNLALDEEDTIDTSNYSIQEVSTALYAQYVWDGMMAGRQLRASLGGRYYKTELTSEGISQGVQTKLVRDYSGLLPTLNLSYEVAEDVIWRFGASKNLTRPSLSALSFSADVSQTSLAEGEVGKITVGNPYLEPFESINFDTSVEWYMEGVGFVSVAAFYKDIKNFIVDETEQVVYSELMLPAELLPDGKTVDDVFNVTSPQNSDATKIKGLELAFQRDFDFLPAPFDNLGMIANYTWADGSTLYRNVQNTGVAQEKAFPGLSKTSYNLTVYYETEQFGARVAAAHRSDFITAVESGLGDEDERGYHASTYVDFSAFYNISENVKVNLEGLNLTNVRDELYSDSSDRAYNTTTSGRTYMAGVTVKF